MIQKNKIKAVAAIIPGLIISIVAAYLSKSSPESSLIFDFICVVAYVVYIWGCYHLLIGKGYSKWYLLLIFIPFLPTILVYLLLRDKNKNYQIDLKVNKILNIIIIVSSVFIIWFGSIACLRIFMKIFIVPTLSRLEIKSQDLRLSQSSSSGSDIVFMNLKFKHPIQNLTVNTVSPIFEDHILNTISIFLNNENKHAANILISKYSDNINTIEQNEIFPKLKLLNYIIMFNGSKYHLISNMFNTYMTDFSDWNLVKDIRVVYLLFVKSVFSMVYYKDASLYHLHTDYISGYLIKGIYSKDKAGNNKYMNELWFSKNGHLYNIAIIEKENLDFSDFINTLAVVNESEAESIINNYNPKLISKDIMLASKLSHKITIEGLEEINQLIESHKISGDKVPNHDLNKEILFLKNTKK